MPASVIVNYIASFFTVDTLQSANAISKGCLWHCRISDLSEAEFAKFHGGVKRGDIVGVVGFPGMRCFELTSRY